MEDHKANILRKEFEKMVKLSEEEWTTIRGCLKERQFKKGENLCNQGQTERYLSFIESGICRGYYSKDGVEISMEFMFPSEFVSAYYSFLTQKPSLITVEAMTFVKVISIHKEDLDRFCQLYKNGERIGRLNAERIYRRKVEREISLLAMSATERYAELVSKHSKLLRQIPLKHIASFLGIQPESLSRIRKNFNSK